MLIIAKSKPLAKYFSFVAVGRHNRMANVDFSLANP